MDRFFLGQRVSLDEGGNTPRHKGRIVGTCTEIVDGTIPTMVRMMYLVKLDEGFYNPAQDMYVSMIPVHPSNLLEQVNKD